MKKFIFFFLLFWFCTFAGESYAGTCGMVGGTVGSAPWTAETASRDDVNYCINTAAAEGDTINVPAGSVTWNSRIEITKGITLIGAGAGVTNITSGYIGTGSTDLCPIALICYEPATPANDTSFRISGFTFDMASKAGYWLLIKNNNTTPQTKIRIDHNTLNNRGGIKVSGTTWGVVDNNTWDSLGASHPALFVQGNGLETWQNFSYTPGSANNIYFEDNTVSGTIYMTIMGGGAGRYSARYNTITTGSGWQHIFDIHGNQHGADPGGYHNYSMMGNEIYSNQITRGAGTSEISLMDHRGGKALIFYNNVTSTGTVQGQNREECLDSICPPATNPIDGTPQKVNSSYYWNNRKNATTLITILNTQNDCNPGTCPGPPWYACSAEDGIAANREYWNYTASFDGTTGMGCGTLASRPATCTTGVGYWATDQSCANTNNMVGVKPTTPISGTLYKCTAPNTWTAYYTPYTYPHPLRGEMPKPPPNVRIVPP